MYFRVLERKCLVNIKKLTWDFLDSNMYLIEEDTHLLVIDVIDDTDTLLKCFYASSVTVLLTHEHFDHICGLNTLRKNVPCQVIASKACSERIKDNKANMSLYVEAMAEVFGLECPKQWIPFVCQEADIVFGKFYEFRWRKHLVKCFSTPGHSAGSSTILMDNMLFVGDTVLDSRLMVKFPGSSKKLYKELTVPLLEKLLTKVSFVYPGHGTIMKPDKARAFIKEV